MSSPLDRPLVLVMGKGGVGRSTVAAAIAAASAARGKRTLLFEANAKDRYQTFFGSGAKVGETPVELRPNLFALNTNPTAALHEYGVMVLRFERVYRMVFENRLTRHFLRAIPGIEDYSLLGKAWYHTRETAGGARVWDTVVFDMPASGHALSMLKIPMAIIDAVPDGPLTRDARTLQTLLRDSSRTAIVMVTLAEEMPANEAREVRDILRDQLKMAVTCLVVNQVHPDLFPAESPASRVLGALAGAAELDDPDLAALVAHGCLSRSRRELNKRYLDQLVTALPVTTAILPFLFRPALGPAEIDQLAQLLERIGS